LAPTSALRLANAMNEQTETHSRPGPNVGERICRVLLAAALFLSLGTRAAEAATDLIFTDITSLAGVALPNTLNESLAWGDIDGDGDQDLYLTNNGANKLFRNEGGGVFTEIAAAAGVDHAGFSVGAAFGDLDNDGDVDLYVVSFGSGPDVLYRNDGPIGLGGVTVFSDQTVAAGTTNESSSRGVGLLDYDRDGLLDIYVNAIGPDILYRNQGNFQFTNVAPALGVDTVGLGVGVVATDLDNNGWVDIFTGNRSHDLNRLYLNNGGTFADLTLSAGIDQVGLGMGVLSFDYDNDLDFDLYWTSWPGTEPLPRPNALYENLGGGTSFADVAASSGTLDPDGWGISCNAGDVNNDGWEDFFVTNGFDAGSTPNVLFLNNTDSTFSDVTFELGGADFDGRGVAFADIDNDGDLDLCVTGGPNDDTRLWRNDSINSFHWITLTLEGVLSNRSAIGARIEVETDTEIVVKEVSSGAGRGSQNSLPVEFGLGMATEIQEIRIRWPHGATEVLTNVAMDQFLTVVETAIFTDDFESGDTSTWQQAVNSP